MRRLRWFFTVRCRYCEKRVFAPWPLYPTLVHNFGTCLIGLSHQEVERRLATNWKPAERHSRALEPRAPR